PQIRLDEDHWRLLQPAARQNAGCDRRSIWTEDVSLSPQLQFKLPDKNSFPSRPGNALARLQVVVDRALPGVHLALKPGAIHAMEFGVAGLRQRSVGVAKVRVGLAIVAPLELDVDLGRYQPRSYPAITDAQRIGLILRALPDALAAVLFRRDEDAVLLGDP